MDAFPFEITLYICFHSRHTKFNHHGKNFIFFSGSIKAVQKQNNVLEQWVSAVIHVILAPHINIVTKIYAQLIDYTYTNTIVTFFKYNS